MLVKNEEFFPPNARKNVFGKINIFNLEAQ